VLATCRTRSMLRSRFRVEELGTYSRWVLVVYGSVDIDNLSSKPVESSMAETHDSRGWNTQKKGKD
jgi:hypothetical protein